MSAVDNPPAFPSVCLNDPGYPSSAPGMALRDWFAGQALAGYMANAEIAKAIKDAAASVGMSEGQAYACAAYEAANAMLAERAKVAS